jgi:hypothetical protein
MCRIIWEVKQIANLIIFGVSDENRVQCVVQMYRHPKLFQLPRPPNPHEHRCVVYSIISSDPVIPSSFYPFPISNSPFPIPHPFQPPIIIITNLLLQIYKTAKRFSQPIYSIYYNPTFINPFQKATLGYMCV